MGSENLKSDMSNILRSSQRSREMQSKESYKSNVEQKLKEKSEEKPHETINQPSDANDEDEDEVLSDKQFDTKDRDKNTTLMKEASKLEI